MELTLKKAAEITGAELNGDENFVIRHICDLTEPKPDGVCYVSHIEKVSIPAGFVTGAVFLPKTAKNRLVKVMVLALTECLFKKSAAFSIYS